MYEPLTKLPGRQISIDEFGAEFDAAWEGLSERFFKLECAQYYKDSSYEDFASQRYDDCIAKLVSDRLEDLPFLAKARANGARLVRVHIVQLPLSRYVEFEFYSYYLSEKCGERVLVIDDRDVEATTLEGLTDFVLFDDRVGFVQTYERGTLRLVTRVETSSSISSLVDVSDILEAQAKPFREFMSLDPNITAKIDKLLLSSEAWTEFGSTSSRRSES